MYIREGILYFTYLPIRNFDLQVAEQIVNMRLSLQREKPYPILCDIRQLSFPTLEARHYLALQGSILTKAVAYLTLPQGSTPLTRFFIHVDQPLIPNAMFTLKEEAIRYLEQYV